MNPLQDKIVDIDFEDNLLSKVSQLPQNLPVQRLSFRQNQITTIEFSAFENLPYLSYLDLSYNLIGNLTEEMFKGPTDRPPTNFCFHKWRVFIKSTDFESPYSLFF